MVRQAQEGEGGKVPGLLGRTCLFTCWHVWVDSWWDCDDKAAVQFLCKSSRGSVFPRPRGRFLCWCCRVLGYLLNFEDTVKLSSKTTAHLPFPGCRAGPSAPPPPDVGMAPPPNPAGVRGLCPPEGWRGGDLPRRPAARLVSDCLSNSCPV